VEAGKACASAAATRPDWVLPSAPVPALQAHYHTQAYITATYMVDTAQRYASSEKVRKFSPRSPHRSNNVGKMRA
jgi:hypothetical protein